MHPDSDSPDDGALVAPAFADDGDDLTPAERTILSVDRLRRSIEVSSRKVSDLEGELRRSNERAARAEELGRKRLRGVYVAIGVVLLLLCGLGALGGWVYDTSNSTDDRFGNYTDQAVINCGIRNASNDALREFVGYLSKQVVSPTDTQTQQVVQRFLKSIPTNLDCSKLKV